MKTRNPLSRFGVGAIPLFLLLGCVTPGSASAQPELDAYGTVSTEAFEGTLSPYGEWIAVGRFGRAWRPYRTLVGADFRPYLSGGHWVYTDYGWTFESDYSWGWAPFHYGRWMMDDYYGWVWVPGTVWGPAWVDWRFGGGYVGWVPLAPAGFTINYGFYQPHWCFVPVTHFVVRDVYHYALPVERFHAAYSATSPIREPVHYGGTQWNAGPPPGQVSQVVGHPIQPVSITPPRPGQVQAVRLGPPSGVSMNNGSPVHSPGVAAPSAQAFGNRPTGSPAPGSPSAVHSLPPPSGAPAGVTTRTAPSTGEAHWGRQPVGDAPHWGRSGEGSAQSQSMGPPVGHPISGSSVATPYAAPPPSFGSPSSGGAVHMSPPPSSFGSTSSGAAAPHAAPPPSFGSPSSGGAVHMSPPPSSFGSTSSGEATPHAAPPPGSFGAPSSGGATPHAAPPPGSFGAPSSGGATPHAAPPPAPPAGHPASGGFVPKAPPGGQGFHAAQFQMGQPAPRFSAAPRVNAAPPAPAYRPPPMMARPSFATASRAPAPRAMQAGGFGGRGHK